MINIDNIKEYYAKIGLSDGDDLNFETSRQFRRNLVFSAAFTLKLSEEVSVRPFICKGINIANIIFSSKNIYITVGDIPISSDGEFRTNLLDYVDFSFQQVNKELVAKIYTRFKPFIISPLNETESENVLHMVMNNVIIDVKKGYPGNFSTKVKNMFLPYMKKFSIPNNSSMQLIIPIIKKKVKPPSMAISLGTKIVPLYIDDIKILQDFGKNINLEIKIGILITKMIFNGIIFGCPMLCKWSVFKMEDLNIFTGKEILENYKNSRKYVKNIHNLYEAENINVDTEIIKTFRAKTRAVINYAEKKMILSKYCVLLVMDTVGRTLADYVLNVLDLNVPNFINDMHLIKSFIFQLTYTLYCLNKHLNIIHGDLHFNNITVKNVSNKDNFTLYMVKGKKYYISTDIVFNIIDFGRVLEPPSIYIMRDKEVAGYYIKRLIKFFARILPETYSKNRDDIENLAFSDGDQLFHLAKALDIYHVIVDIRILLEKNLMPAVRDFIDELRVFILKWIEDNLHKLKNKESITESNINQLILETYFTEYMEPKKIEFFLNSETENKYNPDDFNFIIHGRNMTEKYDSAEKKIESFFKKKLPLLEKEIKEYYKDFE